MWALTSMVRTKKRPPEGARVARRGAGDHYRAWVRHHRASASDSLLKILDHPVSSMLTWLVVGIAMALPVSLMLTLDNLRAFEGNVADEASLSLFLVASVDSASARALAQTISERDDVAGVVFHSRDTALAEFRERSGFADIIDGLDSNPLPHLLLVTPRDRESVAASDELAAALSAWPGVAQAVVDSAWLRRLQGLLAVGERIVLTLALLLGAGVVLILGNTIRLAIESRREEIRVVRLVGGSDAFVRRPFLYTGLWYGVGGGVAAAALTALGLWSLRGPVSALAAAYDAAWRLTGLGVVGSCQLVLAGGVLGLFGAWIAVSRHLRAIESA